MDRICVSIAEGYDRWAAIYDTYPNGLIRIEEPIVHRLCGDVTGLRALDAGCGTGRHTRWLLDHGARVVGVDPNAAMLAVAREKCSGAELLAGSLEALPLPDARFDLAIDALVLEHVPDIVGPIAELARVLVPGGRLVVSVFHPYFWLKGIRTHFEHEGVEYELPTHIHLVSDYLAAVRAAGLVLEDLLEPLVDDATIAALPRYTKHLGHPIALIFAARKA